MSLFLPHGAKGEKEKPSCPFLTSMLVGANELGQPEAMPIKVPCPESAEKCRLWVAVPGECALVLAATTRRDPDA